MPIGHCHCRTCRYVVGDLRGWAAIGIAREASVEVALVERRGAHSGHRRREVRRGQDDDTAADLGGLEAADELAERDLALVLVAVVACDQQDSRALAVLDGSDWDRNPAISRAVNRIRQPDKTVLLAVPLEIDFGGKAGLTASHRAFLCAKQIAAIARKRLSRAAPAILWSTPSGAARPTVAINRAQAFEH